MRIHILSDLHLEFAPFQPNKVDADVMVLAGDVHTGTVGRSPVGFGSASQFLAGWSNSALFESAVDGASPSPAANSQPVRSKSEWQSYKLRTLESYQHGYQFAVECGSLHTCL